LEYSKEEFKRMDAETYLQGKFCTDSINNIAYGEYVDVGYMRLFNSPWTKEGNYVKFNTKNSVSPQYFSIDDENKFATQWRSFLRVQSNPMFNYFYPKFWTTKVLFKSLKNMDKPVNIRFDNDNLKEFINKSNIVKTIQPISFEVIFGKYGEAQNVETSAIKVALQDDMRTLFFIGFDPLKGKFKLNNSPQPEKDDNNVIREELVSTFMFDLFPIQNINDALQEKKSRPDLAYFPILFKTTSETNTSVSQTQLFTNLNEALGGKLDVDTVKEATFQKGTTIDMSDRQLFMYKQGLKGKTFLRPLLNRQKYQEDNTTTRITFHDWKLDDKVQRMYFINRVTKKEGEYNKHESFRYYSSNNDFEVAYRNAWQSNTLPIVEDRTNLIDNEPGDDVRTGCLFINISEKNDLNLTVIEDKHALFEFDNKGKKSIFSGVAARGMNVIPSGIAKYTEPFSTSEFRRAIKIDDNDVLKAFSVQTGHNLHASFMRYSKKIIPMDLDAKYKDIDGTELFDIPFTKFLQIVRNNKARVRMVYTDNID